MRYQEEKGFFTIPALWVSKDHIPQIDNASINYVTSPHILICHLSFILENRFRNLSDEWKSDLFWEIRKIARSESRSGNAYFPCKTSAKFYNGSLRKMCPFTMCVSSYNASSTGAEGKGTHSFGGLPPDRFEALCQLSIS
jgi:hypothetical protein